MGLVVLSPRREEGAGKVGTSKLRAALRGRWPWLLASTAIGTALAGMIGLTASPSFAHTTGTPIPAAVAARLSHLMTQTAKFDGDAHPASISAVTTTFGLAMRTLAAKVTVPGMGHDPTYLVVMKGKFTLENAPVPRGAHQPSGQYLSIAINPFTFRVMALNLRNEPSTVTLRSYGPVSNLLRLP